MTTITELVDVTPDMAMGRRHPDHLEPINYRRPYSSGVTVIGHTEHSGRIVWRQTVPLGGTVAVIARDGAA